MAFANISSWFRMVPSEFPRRDGTELWGSFKRANPFADVVCPTPICSDGHVFITATGGPCHLLKLTKAGAGFTAKDVYNVAGGRSLVNDNGGVILVDKHLYGRKWQERLGLHRVPDGEVGVEGSGPGGRSGRVR